MPLIAAYQCMLLIWIHDAYRTYYQLLMYATCVIDQRVVMQSCYRFMMHRTTDIECYNVIHVTYVTIRVLDLLCIPMICHNIIR